MTACAGFEERVDAIAAGDLPLDAADRAHLSSCAACRGLWHRAQALDAALAARPLLAPSPLFTTQVMTAVRGEYWRAEQVLDLGFNLAVAGGALLVVLGLIGLAWQTGLIVIGGDLAGLIAAGLTIVAERAAGQAPNVGLATLLLTMALGVWWWAEGIEA